MGSERWYPAGRSRQTTMRDDPATIVHVAEDPTSLTPTIWALADESKPVKLHDVIVVGTGSEIPRAPFAHIGTAICGSFVWHVFSDSLRKVGE